MRLSMMGNGGTEEEEKEGSSILEELEDVSSVSVEEFSILKSLFDTGGELG